MAIGTTPLFSELSGSCGPIDYRTRRNGKIEIGKKRIPANPQSADQTATRTAYGRLHELWVNADWIDKTQYNNIAAELKISPWNAFLMRHLPVMRLNPVAYWPFVEGSGNTLHDFTTNKNHGTISGATWERFGKYNIPRLYFDGLDDRVNCGTDTSLDFPDELEFFIWTDDIKNDNSRIVYKYGLIATRGYYVGIYPPIGKSRLTIFADATQNLYSQSAICDVKKHFLICNRKISAYVNIYHDGKMNALPIASPPGTTENEAAFFIGQSTAGHNRLSGYISEIYGCNTIHTDNEYVHLYNSSHKFLGV